MSPASDRTGTGRLRKLQYGLLVVVALGAFVSGITWGLPQAKNPETVEPWALDTVAPISPLNEAYHRFTRAGTEHPIYPLFHYIVLDGAYAPYVAVQYLTGNFSSPSSTFPYGIRDVGSFSRQLTVIARLVSVLMGLGIVYVAWRITREVAGPEAAFWAGLAAALIAPLAYYAKTSNLDVPYAFWVCLAVWRYLHVIRSQQHRDYVLVGAFTALAVATKDQAYGFFLLTPFVLAWYRARAAGALRPGPGAYVRALFSPPMLLAGATALLVYAAANNVFFGGFDGLLRHLAWGGNVYDYRQQSGGAFYTLASQLGLLGRTGIILLQMLGPVSLLLAVGGIVMLWRERNWQVLSLLVFTLSYYLSVIAVFDLVFSRYLLVSAVLLTPFIGIAAARLLKTRSRPAAVTVIAAAIVGQAALVTNLNLTLVADSRVAMGDWIRDNVAPGAVIESQVRQRMLPHIPPGYEVSIAGNSGDAITMAAIRDELTPAALAARDPDYILVLEGLGVTGDPAGWEDPALVGYYRKLVTGELGYRKVAEFETPHFLPFRQIPGTRPTSIMYARAAGAGP